MLPRDFSQISADLLHQICQEHWPESLVLEFKRELPAKDAKGRSEFLKDVCALANAGGGDLLFGIQERDGCADAMIAITADPPDSVARRLGQILDANVEPRLASVQFHPVSLDSGYVLVCRVAQSFVGPHRFRDDAGSWRFVVRAATHTADLTYDQLRRAFDRTSTLIEQAKQFRNERLGRIISGQIWRPIVPGPICAAHAIPLAAMAGAISFDVRDLYHRYLPFMLPGWNGASRSLNLDGLVVHPGDVTDASRSHTQVFRSGAIEIVRTAVRDGRMHAASVSIIYRDAIKRFVLIMQRAGFTGPVAIAIALLLARQAPMVVPGGETSTATVDREHLVLPPIWVDSIEAEDFERLAQTQLDILWQSLGEERCRLYDAENRWTGGDFPIHFG
jgi:hypothetical protein